MAFVSVFQQTFRKALTPPIHRADAIVAIFKRRDGLFVLFDKLRPVLSRLNVLCIAGLVAYGRLIHKSTAWLQG